MTTRLPPYETVIFVKAPCSHRAWNASFALRVTAVNPFIGYRSQPEWGLSEIRHRCLCVALQVAIACQLFYRFHTMSEKPPLKQMKGFGRKLLSRCRHFSLSRVAIGKRHKKWHITAGSDNIRFRRDANISKSELRQLRRRTPAGDICKSYV